MPVLNNKRDIACNIPGDISGISKMFAANFFAITSPEYDVDDLLFAMTLETFLSSSSCAFSIPRGPGDSFLLDEGNEPRPIVVALTALEALEADPKAGLSTGGEGWTLSFNPSLSVCVGGTAVFVEASGFGGETVLTGFFCSGGGLCLNGEIQT